MWTNQKNKENPMRIGFYRALFLLKINKKWTETRLNYYNKQYTMLICADLISFLLLGESSDLPSLKL